MNYKALRDELSNDPLGRGYSNMTAVEVAEDLNSNQRSLERKTVEGASIVNAIVPSEWSSLTDAERQQVRDIFMLAGAVDISSGTNARDRLWNVFGSSTTTRSNLKDLVNDSHSRARELGLPHVHGYHVKHARNQLG